VSNLAQEPKPRALAPDILAGIGLGALTGLLISLSVAQVVGSVVAALAALLGAILGFTKVGEQELSSRPARSGAFGLSCVVAILLGLLVRTNQIGTPSITEQVEEFTQAGFSLAEARSLVAFKLFGLVPANRVVGELPKASPYQAVLFSDKAISECNNLGKERFPNTSTRLAAMGNAAGGWKEFSDAVSSLPEEHRSQILDAAYTLACGS
jgi:hypothetical protein